MCNTAPFSYKKIYSPDQPIIIQTFCAYSEWHILVSIVCAHYQRHITKSKHSKVQFQNYLQYDTNGCVCARFSQYSRIPENQQHHSNSTRDNRFCSHGYQGNSTQLNQIKTLPTELALLCSTLLASPSTQRLQMHQQYSLLYSKSR